MRRSELEIDLGTVTVSCTPDDIGGVLAALLAEMRTVTPLLSPHERVVLRKIMARENGTLTVGEVFPDFHRECEGHKTLRRLRAAQFVRPAEHGRWDRDEPIQIKPFARLMWDRVGEAEIFGDKPEENRDGAADDEVIDLGEDGEDVVDVGQGRAEWDDDAVMDFLRDPRESVG